MPWKIVIKFVDNHLFTFIGIVVVEIHTGNIVVDFLDMVGNIFISEFLHVGNTIAIIKYGVVFVKITVVLIIKFLRNVHWCIMIGIMDKIVQIHAFVIVTLLLKIIEIRVSGILII